MEMYLRRNDVLDKQVIEILLERGFNVALLNAEDIERMKQVIEGSPKKIWIIKLVNGIQC